MCDSLWCPTGVIPRTFIVSYTVYVNDFHLCSDFFELNLFADDASLFCEGTRLCPLGTTINSELDKVYHWLCANKFSLNIDKSNYVIFQPYQR